MKTLGIKTVLCASVLAATPAAANTLMVGPGQTYPKPSAAVLAAQNGDTVEIAAGTYTDCAVWPQNNLTIAGAGMSATTIGNVSCAGKGVMVITGSNVTVRDLAVVHASVPDQNGAGIRAEGTNLVVECVHAMFNQDGILADPVAASHILIRDSYFYANGSCPPGGDCTHGIYIGAVAQLTVEHSTFLHQLVGHHIKSRAAITTVIDNSIEDGPTGTASYLIDVPNGGKVTIRGNHMEKGPLAGNPIAISIGEEGTTWPAAPILITDNVFRNDASHATFVQNDTSAQAQLVGNTMEGNSVTVLSGPGSVQ